MHFGGWYGCSACYGFSAHVVNGHSQETLPVLLENF